MIEVNIKIEFHDTSNTPDIEIFKDGMSIDFPSIDSSYRWDIIERVEKAKDELIRIHRASW